jgi:hypothetical protein
MMDRSAKVAAFCRELGGTTLSDMACEQAMESTFKRAVESLKAGSAGPELEADLDALDEMVWRAEGQGLYPSATRAYTPLPAGYGAAAGAQWWTCPRGWCAGRGRVKPGQAAPSCAAAGEPLVAGPLPE